MNYLLKDPGALLDYAIDWAADYLDGDRLVDSQWSVTPTLPGGIAVAGHQFDSGVAKVTVSGGAPGLIYRLTNEVTTAAGTRDRRSVTLRVEKR